MSVRERWTVYPLLFLAILMAARDDLFPSEQSKFRAIECQELVVTNVNRETLVHIGETTDQSGIIVVYGKVPSHLEPIDPEKGPAKSNENGSLRTADTSLVRSPVVELGADSDGGALWLRSITGVPTICVGHPSVHGTSGVMVLDRRSEPIERDKLSDGTLWGSTFRRESFRESEPAE